MSIVEEVMRQGLEDVAVAPICDPAVAQALHAADTRNGDDPAMSGTHTASGHATTSAEAQSLGFPLLAEAERRELAAALARLERGRGLVVRLADLLGGALGSAASLGLAGLGMSAPMQIKLSGIGQAALARAYDVAVLGLARPQAMRAAAKGAAGSALTVLGVTVLTSMDDNDVAEAGFARDTAGLVMLRAGQAREAGIGGLVCSPNEAELVRDLSVSRMTINRALRELTLEGRLVRVQGVGTFVAEAKMQSPLIEIRNIAEEITDRGHEHKAKVVALEKLSVSQDIIASLDLPTGADIFHSVLVHYENGIPVQLEDRYIDPQLAPDYLKQDFTQITPYVYLTAAAPISEAEHVIEAVLPVTWERRLLKCDSHEPCIQLQRTTWSGGRKVS